MKPYIYSLSKINFLIKNHFFIDSLLCAKYFIYIFIYSTPKQLQRDMIIFQLKMIQLEMREVKHKFVHKNTNNEQNDQTLTQMGLAKDVTDPKNHAVCRGQDISLAKPVKIQLVAASVEIYLISPSFLFSFQIHNATQHN